MGKDNADDMQFKKLITIAPSSSILEWMGFKWMEISK